MAATRKLQAEIERCLKRVAEGVADFEEIWEKLHSSTGNTSKYQDDLKKEIKKLQRYRDQIRSWLLCDEIKDKSVLIENRKIIETQMERFKLNEREAKKKMFSKEGLVSQSCDPIEKERNEVSNWLTSSIHALNVQFDQFECEVESMSIKKKLTKDEVDRNKELKNRMEKHSFHIKKLETLLRMLDNMSVEVNQIKKIQDNINYYIEACQEVGFQDNDFIYEDIEGLDDIEVFGLDVQSPRAVESLCIISSPGKAVDGVESISSKDMHINNEAVDGKKSKIIPKQKGTSVTSYTGHSMTRLSTTKSSSHNLPLQSQIYPSTSVTVWDPPAECNFPSISSSPILTFATVAANSTKQLAQSVECPGPSLLGSAKKLPSLLELCVEPPYSLGHSPQVSGNEKSIEADNLFSKDVVDPQDRHNISVYEEESDRKTPDPRLTGTVDADSAQALCNTSVVVPSLPVVQAETLPPMASYTPSRQQISEYELNYTDILQSQSNRFLFAKHVKIPPYYPQSNSDYMIPSPELYFEKLEETTLFFHFYFFEGTMAQIYAARALKAKNWRYHTHLFTWFSRTGNPIEMTDDYEKAPFKYFDYTTWQFVELPAGYFVFEYKFLENDDLDLLIEYL